MAGLAKLVAKCAAYFAIWGAALSAVVLYLVQKSGDAWTRDLPSRYLVEATGVAGLIVGLVVIGVVLERRPWSSLGLRFAAFPLGIVGGAALGLQFRW
jgi:hypothetical protein